MQPGPPVGIAKRTQQWVARHRCYYHADVATILPVLTQPGAPIPPYITAGIFAEGVRRHQDGHAPQRDQLELSIAK